MVRFSISLVISKSYLHWSYASIDKSVISVVFVKMNCVNIFYQSFLKHALTQSALALYVLPRTMYIPGKLLVTNYRRIISVMSDLVDTIECT